jgi:hypothetical protein
MIFTLNEVRYPMIYSNLTISLNFDMQPCMIFTNPCGGGLNYPTKALLLEQYVKLSLGQQGHYQLRYRSL